jgi:hypothetical protein
MSFRGLLLVLVIIAGLLFYSGKPQQWWESMQRAATQVHAAPPDSGP